MIPFEDLTEEELTLVRDILRHITYILALLLVLGVFFTGCVGCGILVAVASAV